MYNGFNNTIDLNPPIRYNKNDMDTINIDDQRQRNNMIKNKIGTTKTIPLKNYNNNNNNNNNNNTTETTTITTTATTNKQNDRYFSVKIKKSDTKRDMFKY